MSYFEESNIYTLTDFQAGNLMIAANGQVSSFAVIEPTDEDDAETQAKLRVWLKDTEDLLQMGLIEDISKEFSEQIATMTNRDGRSYRVYTLTEPAFLMFHNFGERVAN